MKPSNKWVCVLTIVVLATPAMATVTGIEGMPLQYLIDTGGTVQSGDKLFSDFSFRDGTNPAGPVGDGDGDLDNNIAEYIIVNPVQDFMGNYGLSFEFVDALEPAPGFTIGDFVHFAVGYEIQVLDPQKLIDEAHLELTEFGFPLLSTNIREKVFEEGVKPGDGSPVAELNVFLSGGVIGDGDGDMTQVPGGDSEAILADWESLPLADAFRVISIVDLTTFDGEVIDLGAVGRGEFFTILGWQETFGQTVIPTPIAAGMGLGLLTVLGVMRRRRAQ